MKFRKTLALALLLSVGAANVHAGHVFRLYAKGVRAEPAIEPVRGAVPPVVAPPAQPTPPPVPKDPERDKVVLFTPFDGAEGSRAVGDVTGIAGGGTTTGNAHVSATDALFGGTSLVLDGASSVSYGYSTAADATSDFTAEFWVRSTPEGSAAWAVPMCGGLCFTKFDGGWGSGYGNGAIYTSDLYFEPVGGGNGQKLIISRNGQWNDGRWHHIAVTRAQGFLRGFIDGAQTMPGINAPWAYPSYPVTLGRGIKGGLDDVRITYGVARYTAPFTPPTAELPY